MVAAEHAGRDTYKSMERIFYEQCEVHEEKVCVKKKTGGDVMQNPSDPGATYDGHKGSGYQVQLSETCHPENEVQLITCALPQTAVEPDSAATGEVLDNLEETELLPQEMLVDTHYCSDENVQHAAARGVELVGPTPPGSGSRQDTGQLNIDDFDIDEETEEVLCCPAGHQPESSVHDTQTAKTRTIMPESACSQCEYVNECPIKKSRHGYELDHTAKERRLAGRRREEATEVFRERYRIRGGIEGTNSSLKRRTGLGRLRVRGQPGVFHCILLKVAGWNILRAAACAKMREIVCARAVEAVDAGATPERLAELALGSGLRVEELEAQMVLTAVERADGNLQEAIEIFIWICITRRGNDGNPVRPFFMPFHHIRFHVPVFPDPRFSAARGFCSQGRGRKEPMRRCSKGSWTASAIQRAAARKPSAWNS